MTYLFVKAVLSGVLRAGAVSRTYCFAVFDRGLGRWALQHQSRIRVAHMHFFTINIVSQSIGVFLDGQ